MVAEVGYAPTFRVFQTRTFTRLVFQPLNPKMARTVRLALTTRSFGDSVAAMEHASVGRKGGIGPHISFRGRPATVYFQSDQEGMELASSLLPKGQYPEFHRSMP